MTITDTDAPATLDEARAQADAIEPPAPPAADAKPKRTRAPRKRAPRKPAADRKPRTPATPRAGASLRGQLEEAITGVGLLVFVMNAADGQLIMAGAARQAAALDALAKENPAVRAALLKLMRTSVYAQLAMAFAPTLLGIAANHGVVPPIVGALVGAATSSPAGGSAGEPEAAGPLAGVDLADLTKLADAFSAGAGDGGSEGVPFGRVVAGANAVG